MADPFPLYLPPDAPRLFQTESLLRRMAQTAAWDQDSQLVELHGSLGGLALARALGCRVTVVEPDAKVLADLKERTRVAGLESKVTFLQGDVLEVATPTGLSGLFTFSRVLGIPGPLVRGLRPRLAERGRVGFLCVVRVGRSHAAAAVEAWERRLGAPLLLARDVLMEVEREGFEPDLMETVGEAELEEFYRTVDMLLQGPDAPSGPGPSALKEEIALHRAHGASCGVTLAYVLARRKEPGEKPPLSRDSG